MDLRYAGQGYELRVSLDGIGRIDAPGLAAARERFDARHAQIHGHAAREKPVEVVSYRVRARVAVPKYQPRELPLPATVADASNAMKGHRTVWFDGLEGVDVPVYEREGLGRGMRIEGPALVEQMDATTVIPVGWNADVDAFGNLILTRDGATQ
jgi:N-methylhydantoinase A